MVWIVEKKVIHHFIDLGFERLEIPIRVKFEFEVKEGIFVPHSLSTHILYNKKAIEKRYPQLKQASLEGSIEEAVKKEIKDYLEECGLLKESVSLSTDCNGKLGSLDIKRRW